MTTMQPRELWSTMPGWGIVANLIPPEVLQARRVRAVRRLVALALCLLVLVASLGYGYAFYRSHQAAQALAAEQSQTSALLIEQNRYSGVTEMQGSVAQVRSQLATLMASDVDSAALVGSILKQLPAGSSVSQLAVTITGATASPTTVTTNNNSAGAALDTSGQPHIGAVTISGQAAKVADVATFVNRLAALPGVVSPYPTANTANDTGTQFTVQFAVNDSLLSHRYDASATSGSSTGGN